MTRFRGMISTQPGSTPLSSFKIVSLEEEVPSLTAAHGNDIGPYGDQDDELVFIQKLVPETDVLTVRLASRGTRVAEVGLGHINSACEQFLIFPGSQCGWVNYYKLLCARV